MAFEIHLIRSMDDFCVIDVSVTLAVHADYDNVEMVEVNANNLSLLVARQNKTKQLVAESCTPRSNSVAEPQLYVSKHFHSFDKCELSF